jgi:molybdopterin synthase catalytic subunit
VEAEMIEITEKPIEVWKVLQSVLTDKAGGIAHFIGTVRRDRGLTGLFYECYPEMALRILIEIGEEAQKRWPIEKISVVHRYGWVELGEPSIVIAVSSAHRREAFAACQVMIDRIKEVAPIWKREFSEKDKRFEYVENL